MDTGTTGASTTNFDCITIQTPYERNPATPTPARQIIITPLDHGYEVKAGCQTLAIESPEKLCKHLLAYLKNPAGVEKKFVAGKYKL